MHDRYDDRDWQISDYPLSAIRAEAQAEAAWDSYFRRDIAENPPELRLMRCDDCGRSTGHHELVDGGWQCKTCGGTA